MFEAIAIIVIVVVILIGTALIFASTKPDTFRIQRATSIKASPERIFALINDLPSHGAWSPWEKKDPEMKRTYSGPSSGKGAMYEWDGNRNIGKGRMEIMESSPSSKVTLKLDFIKPFEAHNVAEFILDAKGNATDVTWAMYGPNTYISKVMSLFFSIDKMVGKEFETGLANLKTLTESERQPTG